MTPEELSLDNYIVIFVTGISVATGILGWLGKVMFTSYTTYHTNLVVRNKDVLENFFWPLYFKLLRYYRTNDPTLKNEIDNITVKNIGKFLPRKVIATKLTHFYHDSEPDETLVKELIHLLGVRAIEISHETSSGGC